MSPHLIRIKIVATTFLGVVLAFGCKEKPKDSETAASSPDTPAFTLSDSGSHQIYIGETMANSIPTTPGTDNSSYQLNCEVAASTIPEATVTVTSSGHNCVVQYQNPAATGSYSVSIKLFDTDSGYSVQTKIPVTVVQRQCKKLSLWRDARLFKQVNAYKSTKTVIEYYDYRSASGHPAAPRARRDRSHFFMYQQTGSDDLYLMFTHNYENDGYTAHQYFGTSIDTLGNKHRDSIKLMDDHTDTHQMIRLPVNSSGVAETTYRMDFKLGTNTDGGVIGPFNQDEFAIRVSNLQKIEERRGGTYFYANDGLAPVEMNDPTEQFAVRYVWEACSK